MVHQARKHTSTSHVTEDHDKSCGKMCLLIKHEAEGRGTAGVLRREAGKVVIAVELLHEVSPGNEQVTYALIAVA